MTKKDFELIARTIRDMGLINCPRESDVINMQLQQRNVAGRMADALAQTNPRFDRARFLAACGVTQ